MRVTAPAEGALLLLPFGLSCRARDDDVGLVYGCAECELIDDEEVCGGCRRFWQNGRPWPAAQLLSAGVPVDLEEWQLAVGLGQKMPSASAQVGPTEWSGEGGGGLGRGGV